MRRRKEYYGGDGPGYGLILRIVLPLYIGLFRVEEQSVQTPDAVRCIGTYQVDNQFESTVEHLPL